VQKDLATELPESSNKIATTKSAITEAKEDAPLGLAP
jgi:hypothetical protein